MRHKWSKHKWSKRVGFATSTYRQIKYNSHKYDIVDCCHCINCGLIRGTMKTGHFPKIVYFRNDKVLSTERLPYSCQESYFIGKIINPDFISQEEFQV